MYPHFYEHLAKQHMEELQREAAARALECCAAYDLYRVSRARPADWQFARQQVWPHSCNTPEQCGLSGGFGAGAGTINWAA